MKSVVPLVKLQVGMILPMLASVGPMGPSMPTKNLFTAGTKNAAKAISAKPTATHIMMASFLPVMLSICLCHLAKSGLRGIFTNFAEHRYVAPT